MENKKRSSLLFKVGIVVFVFIVAAAIVVFAADMTEDKTQKTLRQTSADAVKGINIQIYYGDQNGEFLIKKQIVVPEISTESLAEALIEQGILERGTEIYSITQKTQEEQRLLDVDFSEKFREKLLSLGTSGERIFMGSVINTLLDAYGADAIKITVEGKTLESGHAVYDNYQNFYGQVQQRINVTYSVDGRQEETEVLKIYSDLGFATVYDEQTFGHMEDWENQEIIFYDLDSEQTSQKNAYMKVKRFEQSMQSMLNDVKATRPDADLESVQQLFGKEGENGSVLSYTERDENGKRVGKVYLCEHNGFTYMIEINCIEQYKNLQGQLEMMVDEFYFVD